ncbi:hypothetical protein CXG81DRAFT_9668 [Caulochytrium protostelioides]|uniref:Uncharacterized protein n=1 Tax=Caulochytrium protostelioides TaxID=1555241 RepID=A0A4P9XCZ4_9FUNG|nr:hypothetical protein CXG81DRAFT_9668 [Caulochytrium protostelioides]|eukprot:RKP03337.1 hypothetical protein CXG81DRAFT_9668 [Caulochytrium protostelioides]
MAPEVNRIAREIRMCQRDPQSNVNVIPVGNSLTHLKGVLQGPADTVYAAGIFVVDIQISDAYPFSPPKAKFDTRIWHPNISSQTGAICLDLLGSAWTPVITIKTLLISLQSLLSEPVPDDPQDAIVAGQYTSDRAAFDAQAREWCALYATREAAERLTQPPTDAAPAAAGGGGGGGAARAPDPAAGLDAAALRSLVEEMGFPRDAAITALRAAKGNKERAIERLLS